MRPWAAGRLPTLLQIAMVALASAAVVIYAQAPAAGLYGYDGYFHIRFSELIRHDLMSGAGFSGQFPWWQETFLKDQYADKDFLYHLLLIPFTFGDLLNGGRNASIFFAVTLYLGLFLSLKWLRVRAPAAWTLACLLSSSTLLYRAGLLRSHVMAISLALVGTAAILRGHRAGTALVSAAYALTHIAWHLLPAIALTHDAIRSIRERRLRMTGTAASLLGTALAVILNPFFPYNLRLWYVQNVQVLVLSWSSAIPDLGLGMEILPGRPAALLYRSIGPILFTATGILLLAARPRTWEREDREMAVPEAGVVTLGLVTVGFFAMSFLSRRFVEFWAPMSVLFAAAALSWRRSWRTPPALAACGVLLFAGLGLLNLSEVRRNVSDDPGPVYQECASRIRDRVPAGQTVFTTDWDEFPELFFVAPRQRYLVGLDPTFMYVTDPGRWHLWRDIVNGGVADIYDAIAGTFRCRYVFADAGYTRFVERASQDPLFDIEFQDHDCSLFSLREAEDPEGAAVSFVHSWQLEGGASLQAGPRDLIDVGRMWSAPFKEGECALLRGELNSTDAGTVTLSVSTEDPIQVKINDDVVYDSATIPPPTLDEVLQRHSAGRFPRLERTFKAKVASGDNRISVSTCAAGEVWGFHLRILLLRRDEGVQQDLHPVPHHDARGSRGPDLVAEPVQDAHGVPFGERRCQISPHPDPFLHERPGGVLWSEP